MIVRTYSYKGIGLHEIRADVYRPDADSCAPVVLWLHGGGPIFGSRKDFGNLWAAHLQRYLAAGFVVVAVDYRLAPETKLDAIVEDVRDAHRWVCDVGSQLFGIDAGRIGLGGHSAGGFLALTAGWMLRPRPAALQSLNRWRRIRAPRSTSIADKTVSGPPT